ncbi:MAG TPA: DUF5317 family protein [Actinomycetota bacterium]|jgi:Family of unknown function (DUF5317)|nr:DUF5317 family protein [Actinomycetota bacterium]
MGELLLFLLVAGAGVAVGLARGGSLRALRHPGVRSPRLGLACLAVQALVVVLPLRAIGLPLGLGAVLLLAALVTLLGVARANGRLPGVPLLALGLFLNLLVVLANLGMPVPAATLERAGIAVEQPAPDRPDAKHVLERDGTRLGVLGDRLAVRPLRTVTAYGTVIELAGLFLLLQHLTRGPGPFRREDGTAHGAPEARTVPWTTWAE